ncbi:MAG: fibronectin type III domain-containing protein [Bacteroidales bacterium]|nr:fibronectin type III domain-containing protein [Bacteroidales bacterium]
MKKFLQNLLLVVALMLPWVTQAQVVFNEGFETGYTDQQAVGSPWTQIQVSGSNSWTANSSSTDHARTPEFGNFNAYLKYSSTNWLIRPVTLTGGTTYLFSMKAKQDASTGCTMMVCWGSAATAAGMTDTIVPATAIGSSMVDLNGSFTPDTSGTYYIGIYATLTYDPWYVCIDNIKLEQAPSCMYPDARTLAADTVTSSSATLTWAAGGTETAWNVFVSPTQVSDFSNVTATPVTSRTYTATGLTANTPYYFYVQAVCDTNDVSSWTEGTFRTACAMMTLTTTTPLREDFEQLDANTIPSCWLRTDTYVGYSATYPSVYTSDAYEGSKCLYFYTTSTYNSNIIATPELSNINTLRVNFFAKSYVSSYSNYIPTVFAVGVLEGDTGFVAIDTIALTSTYAPYEVQLGGYSGNGTRIAFKSYKSGSSYAYVDNVVVSPIPSCQSPINVTIADSTITATTAVISWTSRGTETSWKIVVSDSLVANPDSVSGSMIATNPYTATGLTPNTPYYVYVKANCGGGDMSEWSWVATFRTGCAPISTMATDGFEEYAANAVPFCWQQVETYTAGSTVYPCVVSVDGHTGSKSLQLYTYATGSVYSSIIATPEFNNLDTLRVRFYAKTARNNEPALFAVGVMEGDTAFVAIDTITLTTSYPTDPYEVRFNNYNGNASRIAFYCSKTTGASFVYIDDVTVDGIPSCSGIIGLGDSAVTADGAAIYWTAVGSESEWNLIVSDTAVTDFSGWEPMLVNENPFVVGGLNSNTLYYVYVQAVCDTNDVSAWSAARTFTTLCGIYAAPFHENFDSVPVNSIPGCWSNTGGTASATNTWKVTTGTYVNSSYTAYHSAPRSMEFNCYSASNGQTGVLKTPVFSLNGHYVAKFWLANMSSSTGDVSVYLSTDGGVTYTDTLEANITNTSGWVEKEYDLQSYDQQSNLVIVWVATSDYGSYNIFLDDVSIEPAPTCRKPSDVRVINVGHDNADIAWTAGGSESQWNIIVSDSVITDFDNAPNLAGGIGNPYTAQGLSATTTYYVYVQSDCGNGDVSEWTRAMTFTTTCNPVAAPIVENFATTAANSLPTCWSKISSNSYPYVDSSNNAYTDSKCLRMYGSATQVAIMPPVSDMLSTLRVNFFAKSYVSYSSYIPSVFAVGVMEGSNFVGIDTITLTSSYAEHEVSLAGYQGTSHLVAFKASNGTSYFYVYLDSVVLQALPSCPAPVNVAATNVTTNSADIIWTRGDTNQSVWEIVVSDTNYIDTNMAQTVYNQPYPLTNLNYNTTYYVTMRANCIGENSRWSNVYSFTTPCPITQAPFAENFDNVPVNSIPGCWNNAGGTASETNTWKVTTGTHVNSSYPAYHSAPRSMEFNCYSASSGETGVLKTPVFELNGHFVAKFWLANMSSTTGDVSVYLSTDGGVTFTDTLEANITNTSGWVEKTYDLQDYDRQNNLVIVWVATSDNGWYNIFIDDFAIEQVMSCPRPTDLVSTGNTSSSVSLRVIDSVNTNGWELVYGPTGMNPDSMLSSTQLYGDTVTVTGLLDTMYYDFYVRANCTDNTYSHWRGPVSVMPGLYVMGTTAIDTLRTCGVRIADNGGLLGDYSANASDTVFIYPSSTDSLVRITGTLNSESNYDFLYIYDGIGVSATLMGRYSGMATIDTTSVSGPITLVFTSDGGTQGAGFDLTVSCVPAPSCAEVQNLTVENIAGASATLRWIYTSTNSTPSNYSVLVIDTATGDTAYVAIVDTNVVDLIRLSPVTTYRVSVITNCDNAEISEPVIVYFTTTCLAGGDFVVGTGTSTTDYLPAYYYYSSTLSQQIFEAAEFQQDTILGLAFYANSDATGPYTFNIYLDTTSQSSYNSYSNYVRQDSTHRVFSATNYTFTQGWNEFRFATPYVKPAGNLIVTVEKTSGNSSSFTFLSTSTTGNYRAVYAYSDDTVLSANEQMYSTSYSADVYVNASRTVDRNNIKFLAPCIDVTCVAPSVRLGSVSDSSAVISWYPGLSETNWKVEYLAAGDSVWVVVDTNTTLMATTITGLQPNHTYVVRVSSLCTDTTMSTLLPIHTDCAETTLPFAENFDSYAANSAPGTAGVAPDCWNIIYNGTNMNYVPHVYNGTYAPNASNNALIIVSGSESYGNDNYAVLPSIATNGNNVVVSFAYRMEDANNGVLTLGYMTNVNDASSYVGVRNFNGSTTKVEAECELGTLPANARIAFRWTYNTSWYSCAIDDVLVQRSSSCGRAQRINVDSTTTTAAYISFVDTNNAGDYTIFWSTTNDAATAVDSISVMGSPCTLTNLQPGMTYYAWLRVNCTSEPSGLAPIPAINTQCAPVVVTTTNVYTQNFEAGVLPNCWSQVTANNNVVWTFDNSGIYAHNSSNAAGFDETANNVVKLVTGEFDFSQLDTNARIIFWRLQDEDYDWWTYESVNDSLIVYYKADASDSAWTVLARYGDAAVAWTKEEVVLPNSYGATTYQVAFEAYSRGGDGVYIDDVTISRMSTCATPTSLAANYVGSDSVVLGWGGTNSSYIVVYREQDSTTWQSVTSTATLRSIGGLQPNTTYEVGVYGVCSGDTSYMSDPITFTTYCSAVAVPYTENFNSYTTGLYTGSWTNHPNMTMPTCWRTLNRSLNGTTSPYVAVANYNSYTVDSSKYLIAYSNYSTPLYMILPMMDEPIDTLQIQFDYELSSSYLTAVLGVMTNPADANSFLPLDTLEYADNHVQHYFPRDNALNSNANYYIAIMVKGSGYYLSLDNLSVDYAPTCYEPTALAASAIGMNTATLGWTSTATRFELNYRQQGSATTPWTSVAATSTTANLTGLSASTTYEARVRAICSATDTSDWSQLYTFTTTCAAQAVPYSQDFESYTGTAYDVAGVLPRCWDAYSDGTSNLYFPHVVDGSGSSYNYCHGTRSLVMTSGAATYGSVKVVALPEFTTPVNQLKMDFWMSTESSSYGTLYVGYVTGSNFNTSFVAVKTIPASSTTYHGSNSGNQANGLYDTVVFTNVPATATRIAFKWEYNSSYYTCCVDDIHVNLAPLPCNAPTISGTTVTTNSATVNWTGDGSSYEFAYKDASASSWSNAVAVNAQTYTVTGLTPGTNYAARVRQVCGTTTSAWTTTTFTTDTLSYYTITVTANDTTMGTVTGGGRYVEGSQVTLTATANQGYHFVQWNDNDTNATRRITVTANATYTATFAQNAEEGIDDVTANMNVNIYPNPASGSTTINISGVEGSVEITIVDMSGRQVKTETMECTGNCVKQVNVTGLSQGAYFVRINAEGINMVKKLIVK